MAQTIAPTRIPEEAKRRLTLLFIAKHALGDGSLHSEDGNHAVYHHEVRTILEGLGVGLKVANRYEALFDKPEGVDFVFPLLNRGGFLNSEMLLPLLCTRHGLPYLGATPILRGLSDDKHLSKLEAKDRGVPTAPWAIFRRGAPVDVAICPPAGRWVIKPNASSASWGVQDAQDAAGLEAAIASVHADGHDAIVEPFLDGSDVEVPVIIANGRPTIMPMMQFLQADPAHLRTYYEKRDLVDRSNKYSLVAYERQDMVDRIAAMTETMISVFEPFDYGRFEFRVNDDTGDIQFLEVNLNCNLWSEKVFGRSAILAGMTQEQLIETIVAESLIRQGLCERIA
ncbi:MAG: phosphoribosylglycinamide synthetase [Sphingopyxis sp.]|nr:phosphoribosylglycinamide synthetase [Sphingopyxis sp.]